MDDSLLIASCKKKNKNAQEQIYKKYASKMMGVCVRYCNNREVAQDLLHDGFIQAFTHIDSFSGKGSFEGWLRRIFVNLAIENYRQEKKKMAIVTDIENIDFDKEDEDGDEFLYLGELSHAMLLDLINELPTGYKTVFNLFVFEDMSHREIGQALGINESASR